MEPFPRELRFFQELQGDLGTTSSTIKRSEIRKAALEIGKRKPDRHMKNGLEDGFVLFAR